MNPVMFPFLAILLWMCRCLACLKSVCVTLPERSFLPVFKTKANDVADHLALYGDSNKQTKKKSVAQPARLRGGKEILREKQKEDKTKIEIFSFLCREPRMREAKGAPLLSVKLQT